MGDPVRPPESELDSDAEYDANGVDRTLVRITLRMTPAERVRSHDALLADVLLLEEAGRTARDGHT